MQRFLLICLICCLSITSFAQQHTDRYWVYFTDKQFNTFSKQSPEQFLSKASLNRREKQHIPISESDLPVSEYYIQSLENIGVQVYVRSKWLNAVSVIMSDDQMLQVSELPFVNKISRVGRYQILNEQGTPLNDQTFYRKADNTEITGGLGAASNQIEQINLDTLFDIGLSGDSMVIAVLDAGFFGVDTATLFQSFWDKDQILGYHNFPDNNDQVFNIYSGYHGSWVMSVIAGEVTDLFSGSAPNADLYLYRTEIADSEYVVEEDHWLAAAERADSVGADIINSSLGYTVFDDPTQNHTYEDLDGNTTVVTMAADMAASKGILVCNSAGNEGAGAWHYVSMPSDGDSVLSVGGVDTSGIHVGFSGYGPTFDGRLKPNVVALALGSAVLDPNGYINYLSGTSFSSPLLAGACATLWQAYPEATNMQILHAVEQSAHLYDTPNDSMGYGIPNFGKAYALLDSLFPEIDTTVVDTTVDTTIDTTLSSIAIIPLLDGDIFTVILQSLTNREATFAVYNLQGALMHQENVYLNAEMPTTVEMGNKHLYASGIYFLTVRSGRYKQSVKVFIE
ncbi:MAG TPA: S8 family serine peptidase [Chitinophagales bacterium]|nr:S8 family serine peptidase [Chitinophagales bacterium]HMX03960.1 S8 family serine peptidase [Chitinophagales bacterium]HMZ88383.1 S8 family serine peptidase [Chitinophagales bacterium]HNA58288.1 S8 family serine peptidase [Chitinophagales bacterium]HNE45883.1 S8 family serine peptidase [Chitinophagales bacterium]